MKRRIFTSAMVTSAGIALVPALAQGQTAAWPNRPIKFIVPYAAGGQPDVCARAITTKLGELLGQPIVVDNRPGAGGSTAYNALLQGQTSDGHSFIVSDGAMLSISPLINKSTNYKLGKDLLPVALIGRSSLFLVANAKTGVNSMQEFVAEVRKKPGEYTYASSGVGSNHHLTMEAMKAALNLDIRHVPYKGSGQSTPALVAGQVQFSIAALPSIAGFVQTGQLKLLGANSLQRSRLAPEVPPISDLIPGFDFAPALVVLAAPGVSPIAVERLSKELMEVLKNPDVIRGLNTAAVEPNGGGPAELQSVLTREVEAMAKAAHSAQLKPV